MSVRLPLAAADQRALEESPGKLGKSKHHNKRHGRHADGGQTVKMRFAVAQELERRPEHRGADDVDGITDRARFSQWAPAKHRQHALTVC